MWPNNNNHNNQNQPLPSPTLSTTSLSSAQSTTSTDQHLAYTPRTARDTSEHQPLHVIKKVEELIPRGPDGTPIPETTLRRLEGYDTEATFQRLLHMEVAKNAQEIEEKMKNAPPDTFLSIHLRPLFDRLVATQPTDLSKLIGHLPKKDQLELRQHYDAFQTAQRTAEQVVQALGEYASQQLIPLDPNDPLQWAALPVLEAQMDFPDSDYSKFIRGQQRDQEHKQKQQYQLLNTTHGADPFFLEKQVFHDQLTEHDTTISLLDQSIRSGAFSDEELIEVEKMKHAYKKVDLVQQINNYNKTLDDINQNLLTVKTQLYFGDYIHRADQTGGLTTAQSFTKMGTGQQYILNDLNNLSDVDLRLDIVDPDVKFDPTLYNNPEKLLKKSIDFVNMMHLNTANNNNNSDSSSANGDVSDSSMSSTISSTSSIQQRYPRLLPSQQHQLLIVLSELNLKKYQTMQRKQLLQQKYRYEQEYNELTQTDNETSGSEKGNKRGKKATKGQNVMKQQQFDHFVATPFTRQEIEEKLRQSSNFSLSNEYNKILGVTDGTTSEEEKKNTTTTKKNNKINNKSAITTAQEMKLPSNFDELPPQQQESIKQELLLALREEYGDELTVDSLQQLDSHVKRAKKRMNRGDVKALSYTDDDVDSDRDDDNNTDDNGGVVKRKNKKNKPPRNLTPEQQESYSYWSYLNPWSYNGSTTATDGDDDDDFGDDDDDDDGEGDVADNDASSLSRRSLTTTTNTNNTTTSSSSTKNSTEAKALRLATLEKNQELVELQHTLGQYDITLYNKDYLHLDLTNLSLPDQNNIHQRDLLEDFVMIYFNSPLFQKNTHYWDQNEMNQFVQFYNTQEDTKWNIYQQLLDTYYHSQMDINNPQMRGLWESLSAEMKLYKKSLDVEFLSLIEQYFTMNNLFTKYRVDLQSYTPQTPHNNNSNIQQQQKNAGQTILAMLQHVPRPKEFLELTYLKEFTSKDMMELPSKQLCLKNYLIHLFNQYRLSNDYRVLIDIDLTEPQQPKYVFLDQQMTVLNLVKNHTINMLREQQTEQDSTSLDYALMEQQQDNVLTANQFILNTANFKRAQAQALKQIKNPVLQQLITDASQQQQLFDTNQLYVSLTASLQYDPNYLNVKQVWNEKSWAKNVIQLRKAALDSKPRHAQRADYNAKSLKDLATGNSAEEEQRKAAEKQREQQELILSIKQQELHKLQRQLKLPLTPLPQQIIDRTMSTTDVAVLDQYDEYSVLQKQHQDIAELVVETERRLEQMWDEDEREINLLLLNQQHQQLTGTMTNSPAHQNVNGSGGDEKNNEHNVLVAQNRHYLATLKHVFEPLSWLDQLTTNQDNNKTQKNNTNSYYDGQGYRYDQGKIKLFDYLQHALTQDMYTMIHGDTENPNDILDPFTGRKNYPHLANLTQDFANSPLAFVRGEILPTIHPYRCSPNIVELLSVGDGLQKNQQPQDNQQHSAGLLPSPLGNDNNDTDRQAAYTNTLQSVTDSLDHHPIEYPHGIFNAVFTAHPTTIPNVLSMLDRVQHYRDIVKEGLRTGQSVLQVKLQHFVRALNSTKTNPEEMIDPAQINANILSPTTVGNHGGLQANVYDLSLFDDELNLVIDNIKFDEGDVLNEFNENDAAQNKMTKDLLYAQLFGQNKSRFDLKALLNLPPEELLKDVQKPAAEKSLVEKLLAFTPLAKQSKNTSSSATTTANQLIAYTPPEITPPVLDTPAYPHPNDVRSVLLFDSLDPQQRKVFEVPQWQPLTKFSQAEHPHETHKGNARHPFNKTFVVSGDTNRDLEQYTAQWLKLQGKDMATMTEQEKRAEAQRIFLQWTRQYPTQAFNRHVVDMTRDHAYISQHPAVQVYLKRRYQYNFIENPTTTTNNNNNNNTINYSSTQFDDDSFMLSPQEFDQLGISADMFPEELLQNPLLKIYLKHQSKVQKSRFLALKEIELARAQREQDEQSIRTLQETKRRLGMDVGGEEEKSKSSLLGNLLSTVKTSLGLTDPLDAVRDKHAADQLTSTWPFIFGIPEYVQQQIDTRLKPTESDVIYLDRFDYFNAVEDLSQPLLKPEFVIKKKTPLSTAEQMKERSRFEGTIYGEIDDDEEEDPFSVQLNNTTRLRRRLYNIELKPQDEATYINKLNYYDNSFYLFGQPPKEADEDFTAKMEHNIEYLRTRVLAEEHGMTYLDYVAYVNDLDLKSQPEFNTNLYEKKQELERQLEITTAQAKLREEQRKARLEQNKAKQKKENERLARLYKLREESLAAGRSEEDFFQNAIDVLEEELRKEAREEALKDGNAVLDQKEEEWFNEQDVYYVKYKGGLQKELEALPLLGQDGTNLAFVNEMMKLKQHEQLFDPFLGKRKADADQVLEDHKTYVEPNLEFQSIFPLALVPLSSTPLLIQSPVTDEITGQQHLEYYESRLTVDGESVWRKIDVDWVSGDVLDPKDAFGDYQILEIRGPNGDVLNEKAVKLLPRTWHNVAQLDPVLLKKLRAAAIARGETPLPLPANTGGPDAPLTKQHLSDAAELEWQRDQRRMRRGMPLKYEMDFHFDNPALGEFFEEEFGQEYRMHLWREQEEMLVAQGIAKQDELPDHRYDHLFSGHYKDYVVEEDDPEDVVQEKIKRRRLVMRDIPVKHSEPVTILDLLLAPRPLVGGIQVAAQADPKEWSDYLRKQQIEKQARLELWKAQKQQAREEEWYRQNDPSRLPVNEAEYKRQKARENYVKEQEDYDHALQQWLSKYPEVIQDLQRNPERYYESVEKLMEYTNTTPEDITSGRAQQMPKKNIPQGLLHDPRYLTTPEETKLNAFGALKEAKGFDIRSPVDREQVQLLYHTLFDSSDNMKAKQNKKTKQQQNQAPTVLDQQAQHTISRNKALLSFGVDPKEFQRRLAQRHANDPNSTATPPTALLPTQDDMYNIVFDLSHNNIFDIQNRLHKQKQYKLYQESHNKTNGQSSEDDMNIFSATIDAKVAQQLQNIIPPKPHHSHQDTPYYNTRPRDPFNPSAKPPTPAPHGDVDGFLNFEALHKYLQTQKPVPPKKPQPSYQIFTEELLPGQSELSSFIPRPPKAM